MRRVLEEAIIKELAGTLSPEQMEKIKENIDRQEEALSGSPGKINDMFFELDDEMHRLLYEFSHRARIWDSVHGLCSHYDRIRYLDTRINAEKQMMILEQHRVLYYYLMMGIPGNVDLELFYTDHLGRWLDDFRNTYTAFPECFCD